MMDSARHLLTAGIAITLAAGAWATVELTSDSRRTAQTNDTSPTLEQMNAPAPSMAFEPNLGQTAAHVDYISRGEGYGLFLSSTEAVFSLRAASPGTSPGDSPAASDHQAPTVLRMSLVGANPAATHAGNDRLPGASHYFTGSDPAKWQRNVPRYGEVEYKSVYEGIDLVYYGNQGQLEYDFVVAPGTDPGTIAMDYSGIDSLHLDDSGNLVLATAHGDLVQRKPVVYQWVDGARRAVEGAYAMLADARVGFRLGEYDHGLPLVIDPILSYSTYLGGDGWDSTAGIAVDGAGNTYVVGNTNSVEFPWDMGNDSEFSGIYDAYVCRFAAVGWMPYCAYVGGSGDDAAWAVALGPDGNAYVAGYTESVDFPVLNASQPAFAGGAWGDAFVLKINDAGDNIEYSTFYGGNDADVARGIAVDSEGSAYITGHTYSWQQFPVTTGAFQSTDPGDVDAFVAKFLDSGALAYSTYLGGAGGDQGRGVVVDEDGSAFVSGLTESLDFPTKSPVQATNAGGGDIFVAMLDPQGQALEYGTYLGGGGQDWGYDLEFDRSGNLYMGGFTFSSDFPVTNDAIQSTLGGERDGFLVRMNGGAVTYATYFGGSGLDDMRDIALDPAGNVYWAGYTRSTDFPLRNPIQPLRDQDQVLVKLDATGKRLVLSTPIGGSRFEVSSGVGLSRDGTIHITGRTGSIDYPLAAPFQDVHASPDDGDETTPESTDIYLTRLTDASLRSWQGDFDGDGKHDILWRNQATGSGAIWPGAQYAQARNITRITDLDWQVVGVGDFDGDGRDDILWRHAVTGAATFWKGGNYLDSLRLTTVRDTSWKIVGIGDLNGDGSDDIVWRSNITGANAIWGAANYATQIAMTNVTSQAWEIVGVADFDGDQHDDVLWRNTSTGHGAIWKRGNYATQQAVARIAGNEWKVVGLGDYNADGKDDILWRNGVYGQNLIWRSGMAGSQQAVSRVAGHEWQIFGSGDYDGDGASDILWRNHMNGLNAIWRSGNSASRMGVNGVRDQSWVIKS